MAHFLPFTTWINEINNTQVDNVIFLYFVILMYTMLENSDNYSKSFLAILQGSTK